MVATGAMIFVAVPEPTTWALIGLSTGLGAYGIYARRRRAKRTAEQEVVVPVE
ncbi:MAG: IPTL-CTERM sorting domain-containing protein [Gemmatales bacterium]